MKPDLTEAAAKLSAMRAKGPAIGEFGHRNNKGRTPAVSFASFAFASKAIKDIKDGHEIADNHRTAYWKDEVRVRFLTSDTAQFLFY